MQMKTDMQNGKQEKRKLLSQTRLGGGYWVFPPPKPSTPKALEAWKREGIESGSGGEDERKKGGEREVLEEEGKVSFYTIWKSGQRKGTLPTQERWMLEPPTRRKGWQCKVQKHWDQLAQRCPREQSCQNVPETLMWPFLQVFLLKFNVTYHARTAMLLKWF